MLSLHTDLMTSYISPSPLVRCFSNTGAISGQDRYVIRFFLDWEGLRGMENLQHLARSDRRNFLWDNFGLLRREEVLSTCTSRPEKKVQAILFHSVCHRISICNKPGRFELHITFYSSESGASLAYSDFNYNDPSIPRDLRHSTSQSHIDRVCMWSTSLWQYRTSRACKQSTPCRFWRAVSLRK